MERSIAPAQEKRSIALNGGSRQTIAGSLELILPQARLLVYYLKIAE